MKRIRYNLKSEDIGFLFISDSMQGRDQSIRVILNTNDLKYFVVDNTDAILKEGLTKSIQTLKIKAKKAAKEFGVIFEEEVRPKVKF